MTWQNDVTPEQWDDRQALACKASKRKKVFTILSAEEYIAQDI